MGLQNVFFELAIPFDSAEAKALSAKIQEEIYFNALTASANISEKDGPHKTFKDTKAAQGILQFDLWGIKPTDTKRWETLRAKIKKTGLRNSLMIAIAPTATIASITGTSKTVYEKIINTLKILYEKIIDTIGFNKSKSQNKVSLTHPLTHSLTYLRVWVKQSV